MATVPAPKRGEIWLVDFDPAVGAEIRKLRPALVISVDAIGRLPLRMIVPITDWKAQYEHYPWFVELTESPSNAPSADVDGMVSWNFKHMVRLDKIRLFNAVNAESGHRVLNILSPRGVTTYEGS